MDLYVAEVAPDPRLKPAKFLALIRSLPDSARDSHDRIYHAMDMYLEVWSIFSFSLSEMSYSWLVSWWTIEMW